MKPRAQGNPNRRWRNARLVRQRDIRQTRWLSGLLLGIVVALAPFTVYLLQQMEYVRVRYKIEELRTQQNRLVEMEQRLRIDRASLHAPSRVERRAVQDLRLVHPSPHQVVVLRPTPGRGNLMARVPDRTSIAR